MLFGVLARDALLFGGYFGGLTRFAGRLAAVEIRFQWCCNDVVGWTPALVLSYHQSFFHTKQCSVPFHSRDRRGRLKRGSFSLDCS